MGTFYLNHEAELYHYGVKGMKWGSHKSKKDYVYTQKKYDNGRIWTQDKEKLASAKRRRELLTVDDLDEDSKRSLWEQTVAKKHKEVEERDKKNKQLYETSKRFEKYSAEDRDEEARRKMNNRKTEHDRELQERAVLKNRDFYDKHHVKDKEFKKKYDASKRDMNLYKKEYGPKDPLAVESLSGGSSTEMLERQERVDTYRKRVAAEKKKQRDALRRNAQYYRGKR